MALALGFACLPTNLLDAAGGGSSGSDSEDELVGGGMQGGGGTSALGAMLGVPKTNLNSLMAVCNK